MKDFIKRVVAIYQPFRSAVIVVFVCMILMQALILASPYIYGKIVDGIVSGTGMTNVLSLALIAFLVYMLQNVLLGPWQAYIEIQKIDFDVERYVSGTTLEKLLGFSVGQLNSENSGVKQSVIHEGEHSLSALAYMLIYEVFPLVVRVLFTVLVLMYLSFTLGLVVFVGVALFTAITTYIDLHMKDDLKRLTDVGHDHRKLHTEILRNTELIQFSAQENRALMEYDRSFKKMNVFSKRVWSRYVFLVGLRNIVTGVFQLGVMALGIYYVYHAHYTAGDLVVFLMWSGSVFANLGMLSPIQRRFMAMHASVKKYFAMLDVEPAVKMRENPIRPEHFVGKIEFRNVSFKYPVRTCLEDDEIVTPDECPETETLSRVSFCIEPGQKVAFVGHSGAGKSTIVQLLLRAYDPDEGAICIDGHDLRDLDLGHYREAVGLVEQSVSLFDQTLRYNITFGLNGRSPDVSIDELNAVAQLSGIEKFSARLEKGYDTIIGERGIRLSGGEQQRVSIARALIKDPRFLIFDEATSNLDTENESLIKQSIEEASFGRTTILIAHRLSTIRDADVIFVMEDGGIIGSGTHDELMVSSLAYQSLVNHQIATI